MIVSDHFATFKDEGTGRAIVADFVVVVGVPLLASLFAIPFKFQIKDSYIGTFILVFAIFARFIFNVMVLIYSFSDEKNESKISIGYELLMQAL